MRREFAFLVSIYHNFVFVFGHPHIFPPSMADFHFLYPGSSHFSFFLTILVQRLLFSFLYTKCFLRMPNDAAWVPLFHVSILTFFNCSFVIIAQFPLSFLPPNPLLLLPVLFQIHVLPFILAVTCIYVHMHFQMHQYYLFSLYNSTFMYIFRLTMWFWLTHCYVPPWRRLFFPFSALLICLQFFV